MGALITIGVVARSNANGWEVTFSPDVVPSEIDRRLELLAQWYCFNDVVVARRLVRGRDLTFGIPAPVVLPAFDPLRPYPVSLLVRPLVMDGHVTDNLYSYQRRGVAWLLRRQRALLADDMGLGKTAQAIAAVRRLIRRGHIRWALVVAPRTLIANWRAEATKWGPELTVAQVLATGADRNDAWGKWVGRAHVVLTSYEQLRDPSERLIASPPDLVIADEAHRLRRNEAQATQGIRLIKSPRLWLLSGTPVERDAEDLAVLMSIIEPGRFSPDDRGLHPATLRARSRRYILRRHKTEVLGELPEVIERTEVLELTPVQRDSYKAAILAHARKGESGGYLALFSQLRSICDLDPKTGSSSKIDRIVELLEDIASTREKAVIFSYLLPPLAELGARLRTLSTGYVTLTGKMSMRERDDAVQRFIRDPDCVALLGSSRVASEGLTLTTANHVIFVNRWWNPSANSQARDRVVRIGQERTVETWAFECRGTVETRLATILSSKALTFEALVDALREAPGVDMMSLFLQPE